MSTLTIEILKEAIAKMQLFPPIPEIWYSKHLPVDDAYKWDNFELYPYSKTKIIFVGKNIADKMIEEGIIIQNYPICDKNE